MSRLKKIVGILFSSILILVLAVFISASLYDSPEYARRLLMYGQSDINDRAIFPERPIQNGGNVSVLEKGNGGIPETLTWTLPSGEARTASWEEVFSRTDTKAFIVIRDDKIIYEGYFNGATRDTINTSFSSAKSFNSALIGAAIADGLIESADDPVIKYVPEIAGRGLDTLTIRDLLLMSTGIRYAEHPTPFGDDALTYYSPDLRRTALRVRASGAPIGDEWLYNNYHPLLEGLIIERVTGVNVSEYLQEKFWKPMGAEYSASWSLDSEASGFEKMESGINARAVDYARFGLVFLHTGTWNGSQILPEEWVSESTTPEDAWKVPSLSGLSLYYKYHWWGFQNEDGTYDFMALGRYWQVVYVAPRRNVVVVRLGDDPNSYPVNWTEAIHNLIDQME
ncbi:MAG: serine hydrolase [Anaerolineales bacterium]|nr:MAG: serine hydrolase [Anaerolineales bacterium]